ncbi:MAG: M24 family metallopeptidase [Oscillospiraceae bacterium]|nr:M24 family metallopeptidase [Oscillospiraceae bacterium]
MKAYKEDSSIKARKEEIDIKLKRVRKALDEKSWDALLINKCEAFAWITAGGDSIMTRYVEGGVISILITKTAQYAITNIIEYQRALDEEVLDKLGFEVLSSEWFENKTMEHITRIIGKDGKLASDVPMPGAADAGTVISKMQYSLLDNEIGRYLHLGETFSHAIEEVMTDVKPGDIERDIVGRINNAIWKHGIDAVLYLVAADERIWNYRHCIPTDKKIKDIVMVCCNGRYKGLITKITRFLCFGEPSKEFTKQYEQTLEIENRMIAATQIGKSNLIPFETAIKAYEEFGYKDMWKVHHQGGPQGYTNGYYLMNHDTHELVVKNQCYCYNPSITGTKTEDAFIVTDEGPLMITKPVLFPEHKVIINGIEVSRPGIFVR